MRQTLLKAAAFGTVANHHNGFTNDIDVKKRAWRIVVFWRPSNFATSLVERAHQLPGSGKECVLFSSVRMGGINVEAGWERFRAPPFVHRRLMGLASSSVV